VIYNVLIVLSGREWGEEEKIERKKVFNIEGVVSFDEVKAPAPNSLPRADLGKWDALSKRKCAYELEKWASETILKCVEY
jgi:hypothetical protein